jgi:hypothetical protein
LRRAVAAAAVATLAGVAWAGTESAAAIRAARDAVFQRPEFHYGEPARRSFLADWFEAFAEWQQQLVEEHPVAATVLFVGLAVLLVALIAHIVWTLRMARQAEWQSDEASGGASAMRRGDPSPFRARAVEHAAAGRFDEAVRDLYAALLLTLDRRGALRYAPHKALLDYRIETARDPAVARTLDLFAGTYHPGSFGRRPPDRAHFDELLVALDRAGEPPR